MAFERLGGYAVWKSYIIWKTLQKSNVGDIIVYTDAGCTLKESNEWNEWFELLGEEGTIVFCYKNNFDYGWGPLFNKQTNTVNKNWTKMSVREHFNSIIKDDEWLTSSKVWSGALIVKKGLKTNNLIEEWFKTTLLYPHLSIDILGIELEKQDLNFVQHRHDQTLLSFFAYYYKNKENVILVTETAESNHIKAGIVASRIRDKIHEPIYSVIKWKLKKIIGDEAVSFIKKIINKTR